MDPNGVIEIGLNECVAEVNRSCAPVKGKRENLEDAHCTPSDRRRMYVEFSFL